VSQALRNTNNENDSSLAELADSAVANARPGKNPQDALAEAFKFFNETSQQLAQSYQLLEGRVARLTQELDEVAAEKEQEHQQKEEIAHRMQALLDFLPGGVVVLDARGFIVQSNPAARQMLDHPLEGSLWREVIKTCFAPRNDDGLEVSTRSGRRVSIATGSLEADGQIILLTDQTETRKLQQTVSRYERLSAMGKMVSALAHQIRTPLSAATLYANHLCSSNLTEEKRSQFSHKLLGRLNHMERQVRDMLLFVKSELPLNDVVTTADLELGLREAMEVPIATSASHVVWDNQVPQSRIRCNREALISALLNLVNNAIQAGEGPAHISFSIAPVSDGGIAITIADAGPGMSPDILAQAQEMFMTTKAQGTGLGLAVVKAVARAHGGQFDLNSIENKGTQAVIQLPAEAV
jgi:two-component system sensor histidine kinase FlrB